MESQAIETIATTDIPTVSMPATALQGITMDAVYLMGFSFMIGSLFTVLMLIILDLLKEARFARAAAQKA